MSNVQRAPKLSKRLAKLPTRVNQKALQLLADACDLIELSERVRDIVPMDVVRIKNVTACLDYAADVLLQEFRDTLVFQVPRPANRIQGRTRKAS